MASLWEVDPIQISGLANGQYPQFTNNLAISLPSFAPSGDGDIHVNMGVASTGNTGSMSGNQNESPIVPEVINATSGQLTTIDSLSSSQAVVRGIFRWYSEHTGERNMRFIRRPNCSNGTAARSWWLIATGPNIKFDNATPRKAPNI